MNSSDTDYQNHAIPATGILTLSVRNWEKYSYRSEKATKHSWFRFENNFFDHPEAVELSPLTKLLWVYILAECSKAMGKPFQFSLVQAAFKTGMERSDIANSLKTLVISLRWCKLGTSVVQACDKLVPLHNSTLQNTTEPYSTLQNLKRCDPPSGDATPQEELVQSSKKSKPESAPTGKTWGAYSKTYHLRHGVLPTRNARVNGQLAQFVKRVPLDEAPEIAAFYVLHNRAFYVQKSHPIGLMLADAESLRTEWLNGRAILTQEAKAVESKQQIVNAWAKHLTPEDSNEEQ